MAKNRSRRLRKKMHIDESQELGFSVAWRFLEGTLEEQTDKTIDDFINEAIEPNKLAFDGSGYLAWEGLICMQETGECTEEHQAIVRKWLEERKLDEIRISEPFDVWQDQESIRAMTNAKLPDTLRSSCLGKCTTEQTG